MNKTKVVKLAQVWSLGQQIGRGGFGRVFEGVGADGRRAAIKMIPKEPGADRELLFEDLSSIRNVVPIIDRGESGTNWVIVMPRAVGSLRDHLRSNRALPFAEAAAIMADIATALVDMKGRVVHRDIKPENVLLLDGHWCLADFGIARYAEASTAAETHKWTFTPQYNPPERWRDERATTASDVYSVGVTSYEMLSGHLPFEGPDYRLQHLTQQAHVLSDCPPLLAALISDCLLKPPESRPTPARILERLLLLNRSSSPGSSLLQEASNAQAQRLASAAAAESATMQARLRRRELAQAATTTLSTIVERLGQSIRDNAPTAVWRGRSGRSSLLFEAELGGATIAMSSIAEAEDMWGHYKPKFEVIAHASVTVRIPRDRYEYEGRSHSLWYCDAQEEGAFRWYETAFMINAMLPKRARTNPFALAPDENGGKALSNVVTEFQLAWPFTAVEPGVEDDFIDRWLEWFALAAQGRLSHPHTMPERRAEGSYRR